MTIELKRLQTSISWPYHGRSWRAIARVKVFMEQRDFRAMFMEQRDFRAITWV